MMKKPPLEQARERFGSKIAISSIAVSQKNLIEMKDALSIMRLTGRSAVGDPPPAESAARSSDTYFFRPTPSWLSPGRSTSCYLPEINCENHAMPPLRKAAGVPAAQLVGRRSWRRGQTAGGGSIPRWSKGKPQVVTRRKATGAGKKKVAKEGRKRELIGPLHSPYGCQRQEVQIPMVNAMLRDRSVPVITTVTGLP